MNWNKIKEKYPKAQKQFKKWVNKNVAWYDGFCWDEQYGDFPERELYDFFDEQGIYIAVDIYYSGGDGLRFLAYNFQVKDMDIDFEVNESTRTLAEEKAFEKAFEILEDKL